MTMGKQCCSWPPGQEKACGERLWLAREKCAVFMAGWLANWAGSNVTSELLAGAALSAMELF